MVLCIIAFIVFAFLSVFSAKYRPLAKEGFRCVFRTITMRPCDTALDERIKAEVVAGVLRYSPFLARIINVHFIILSWVFVLLTLGSFVYAAYGLYNFYYYGNCDGPGSSGVCILNDLTGDYGRFSDPKDLIPPTSFDGIVAGNASSNITVVEFGCFTCFYTKKAEPTMQTLLSKYNIRYVFKPFPLPNHKFSTEAALAVLCANRQGKQWELRNEIFSHEEACGAEGSLAMKDLAQSAGLNMTDFSSCFDNRETEAELEKYIQQGKDAHIYATPTFFINGKPLVGPKPIEDFENLIKEEGG